MAETILLASPNWKRFAGMLWLRPSRSPHGLHSANITSLRFMWLLDWHRLAISLCCSQMLEQFAELRDGTGDLISMVQRTRTNTFLHHWDLALVEPMRMHGSHAYGMYAHGVWIRLEINSDPFCKRKQINSRKKGNLRLSLSKHPVYNQNLVNNTTTKQSVGTKHVRDMISTTGKCSWTLIEVVRYYQFVMCAWGETRIKWKRWDSLGNHQNRIRFKR